MLDKVLRFANADERVRMVAMNGSRTNDNAPKDAFQDYDIAFLVTDMASFLADAQWVDIFGKRMIMQTPENMTLFPPELGGRFSYLMLFENGERLDLMLIPIEKKQAYCQEDSLTQILLDKDEVKPLAAPSDRDYWVKKPNVLEFGDCCNEFWWLTTYVAKGEARGEALYALDYLASCRDMLRLMMTWHVGIDTDFSCSVGKNEKYLARYVSKNWWSRLMATYQDPLHTKDALNLMMALFEEVATQVAEKLEFPYDVQEFSTVQRYVTAIFNMR